MIRAASAVPAVPAALAGPAPTGPAARPSEIRFWAAFLVTTRPYLMPVSGAAGLVGLAIAPPESLCYGRPRLRRALPLVRPRAGADRRLPDRHRRPLRAVPAARPRPRRKARRLRRQPRGAPRLRCRPRPREPLESPPRAPRRPRAPRLLAAQAEVLGRTAVQQRRRRAPPGDGPPLRGAVARPRFPEPAPPPGDGERLLLVRRLRAPRLPEGRRGGSSDGLRHAPRPVRSPGHRSRQPRPRLRRDRRLLAPRRPRRCRGREPRPPRPLGDRRGGTPRVARPRVERPPRRGREPRHRRLRSSRSSRSTSRRPRSSCPRSSSSFRPSSRSSSSPSSPAPAGSRCEPPRRLRPPEPGSGSRRRRSQARLRATGDRRAVRGGGGDPRQRRRLEGRRLRSPRPRREDVRRRRRRRDGPRAPGGARRDGRDRAARGAHARRRRARLEQRLRQAAPAGRFLVPLRLDAAHAVPRDLVRVRAIDPSGREITSLLAVSASAGVVAEGNALFNSVRRPRRWTGPAIACAALRAVRRHRDFTCRLTHDGREEEVPLSSLSVLKSPWLSGALRYDLPVAPDDGLFGVAVCAGMGRFRLLATLAGLLFGRFRNRPGTKSFLTTTLGVSADAPFLLEVDGEVERVVEATFDLLAWRVRVCA